jgi:NCS1 family nucleobase:cation symporter-1
MGQYEGFLLLIGSVFAPLFGVVLVDHFILRKRGAQATSAALRGSALCAWLGGVVTYHLLANLYPELGATLPALILAGLLQLVLGRIVTFGRETARA